MGMVDYIVKKMKKELQEYSSAESEVKVIATGGLATLIDSGIDCIDHVDKMLTLEGLELIYRKNKRSKKCDERQDRTVKNGEAEYEEGSIENR